MPSERPDWCKKVNCDCYPSVGRCVLRRWVLESTPLTKARKDKFKDFERLAKENPGELVALCWRKVGIIGRSFEVSGKVRRGRRRVK